VTNGRQKGKNQKKRMEEKDVTPRESPLQAPGEGKRDEKGQDKT